MASGGLHEKCAVTGVLTVGEMDAASTLAYESLFALQHRGTEATGMTSQMPSGTIETHFGAGLVRDVYDDREAAERLSPGTLVIGHNRYSTSGSKQKHPQPVCDTSVGFAMGHNGNLPDTSRLEDYLNSRNLLHRDVNDSEMMAMSVGELLREGKELPEAIEQNYPMFTGAFSCVGMQDGLMVAFRDPYGIRPLALGRLYNGGYAVASETCGLDAVGAKYDRDVRPGELVVISKEGMESRQLAEGREKLDIFEFVYFARHDSQLYGRSVNEVRRQFGRHLAAEHGIPFGSKNAVVIPVPDTAVPEAEGYAEELDVAHRQLIIKSRYIGRTFMQTTDKARKEQLRLKHNIVDEGIRGKDIILVDDSIVRLNTMPRIVELIKSAGACSVSVLIGSPPVRFPDFYGIDTPTQRELAAANLTVEQIRREIGCNYLGFLSLSGMVAATGKSADKFNLSCFTGEYPIDIGSRKKSIYAPASMEYVE